MRWCPAQHSSAWGGHCLVSAWDSGHRDRDTVRLWDWETVRQGWVRPGTQIVDQSWSGDCELVLWVLTLWVTPGPGSESEESVDTVTVSLPLTEGPVGGTVVSGCSLWGNSRDMKTSTSTRFQNAEIPYRVPLLVDLGLQVYDMYYKLLKNLKIKGNTHYSNPPFQDPK